VSNINKTIRKQIIIVRVSCIKEKHRWEQMKSTDHRGFTHVILCGDPELDTNYKLVDGILYLKCGDLYEHLPEKMIAAYCAVKELFSHYIHIIKVDSDVNYDQISKFYSRNLVNFLIHDYSGAVIYPGHSSGYHTRAVQKDSRWANTWTKALPGKFLDGGRTYTLSRKSVEEITKQYNFSNLDKVGDEYVLEDHMIGYLLHIRGIQPVLNGLTTNNNNKVG